VRPAHISATGEERKDVKVGLTGVVWWVAMRRASMTCQGRNLLPCSHHQLHVHQLLLPYLKSTTNYRQQGWPIVYIHEMYIYASHTQPQFCGDRTIGPSCTCSEGSSKLYLSMLDIKS